MNRSSSDKREAWDLGQQSPARDLVITWHVPSGVSRARVRPGTQHEDSRDFVRLSPNPPGLAEAGVFGLSPERRGCATRRPPRGIPAVKRIAMHAEPTVPGHPSPHPSAPPRWSKLVDLGPQASTKRIRIIAQPDRLSGETSSIFSTRRTLK